MNRRVGNLDLLPTRSAILRTSYTKHHSSRRYSSPVHRCRQDPYAARYRQVPRSKLPRRSTPFRVERLADLVACSLLGALGRSLLKKGTRILTPLCHFSCLMFVCRFGRLYRGPALPAYPSCSDRATYVLGDTQASFLLCCSKLPSALPNCMHRRPFVGCALGLISFKRCE